MTEKDRNIFQNANNSNNFLISKCIPSGQKEEQAAQERKANSQYYDITRALQQKFNNCAKEIPKPKSMWGNDLPKNDERITTWNQKQAACTSELDAMINNYLRQVNTNVSSVSEARNISEPQFYSGLCVMTGDSEACKKQEKLQMNMGGKRKSKKSARKTKKVKKSKNYKKK